MPSDQVQCLKLFPAETPLASTPRLSLLDESIGRNLLNEARGLHMIGESVVADHSLSAAMPTQKAAREYAKAEPDVSTLEVVKLINQLINPNE